MDSNDKVGMVNQQYATAVHVMTALGYYDAFFKKDDTLLSSEDLAKSVDTNPVVIRRVLGSLAKAKLVKTTRGKAGGVCLAKPPNQITLEDIYNGVEVTEKIAPHNKSPFKECPVSCEIHNIMSVVCHGVHSATLKYLRSKKLSDLIKTVHKTQKNK